MTDNSETVRRKIERAYTESGVADIRNTAEWARQQEAVVREYAHLVRKIARRFARASGGAVDVEDLTSVGMMGLLDAHGRYDPEGGRRFEVYAEFRVRGAIIDEMRRLDPMSQPMRRKARAMTRVRQGLAQELGREPTSEEHAERMGVSLDEFHRLQNELQPQIHISDDGATDICDNLAFSALDKVSMHSVVSKAIKMLPERSQQVLALYYFQDLTLREIGEVLEVTEARVCQLHKEAVLQMRKFIRSEGL